MKNVKRIIEIISNTYNLYNNNYFNALNINNILSTYIENDSIKKLLNNKYDKICDKIKQKKKCNKSIQSTKEKLKNEITSNCIELMNDKIKEINNKWKNTIEEKLKERDALNNKAVEELLNKISNDTADMMQSQLIKYIDFEELSKINFHKVNFKIKVIIQNQVSMR